MLVSIWHAGTKVVTLQKELSTRVSTLNSEVTTEFASVSQLMATLLNSEELKQYTTQPSPDSRAKLTQYLLSEAKTHPNIDQIRFVDENGDEKVQIDNPGYKGESVVAEKLENIASHNYFRDTMKLNPGEFYVSPLELNVNDSKIEDPINPTIRLASKVTAQDTPAGVVVLNYKAKRLLDFFCVQEITQCTVSKIFFTNSEGFFFNAPNPSQEWGFMYPARTDTTFQYFYPRAWQRILDKDRGRFINSEGIFIFEKIFPIAEIQKYQADRGKQFTYFSRYLSVNDFHMVVILRAEPAAVLYQLMRTHVPHVAILYGIPLVLFILFGILELDKAYRRQ